MPTPDEKPVIALYERWVKAGPPPLGVSLARWWDRRLVELRDAIIHRNDANNAEQSARTTPNNSPTSSDAPDNPPRGVAVTDWTPPPPGDRREQLPDHLLAAIDIPPYTSTACQTADLLAEAVPGRLDLDGELGEWADRLHARCRLQNKFTGVGCDCGCHQA